MDIGARFDRLAELNHVYMILFLGSPVLVSCLRLRKCARVPDFQSARPLPI
jgi:hypothetical protein